MSLGRIPCVPILLSSTLRGIADLSTSDLDWLHQLIADWQVIANLSVSDLVLWARTATNRFVAPVPAKLLFPSPSQIL